MSVKARLNIIVHGTDTWEGRAFDWVVIFLVFYAIVALVYGTMPTLSEDARKFLWISEVVVTALFTLEYILRFYLAERKRDYSFSFYGIIDFAILPFYLRRSIADPPFLQLTDLLLGAEVAVLRSFRALRLLRIFRLLKIIRYNTASDRLLKALSESKEEFVLFFLHDTHPAIHIGSRNILLRASRAARRIQFYFAFPVVGSSDADNGWLWGCIPSYSRWKDFHLYHPLDRIGRGCRPCRPHC